MKPTLLCTALCVFLVPACADTITGAAPDASSPDGSFPDVAMPEDAPVDGAAPDGVSVDASAPDATPTDASARDGMSVDAVTRDGAAVDGAVPSGSLAGRWRVVRFEVMSASGVNVDVSDRPTPVMLPPGSVRPVSLRANGIFTIEPTRVSWSFGALLAEHFYRSAPPSADDEGLSLSGGSAPGVLDETSSVFEVTGGTTTLAFERVADGTIRYTSESRGDRSRITLARAPTSPVRTSLNLAGVTIPEQVTDARTFVHPRFALLWDRPGAAAPVEDHGVALTFNTDGYAVFPLAVAGDPPMALQSRGYGVPVAVGFTAVYDDRDDDRAYTPGADTLRGLGPLVFVWRGEGTPSAAWAASPLSEVQPGWQLAHLHRDWSRGEDVLVPFDTTVPVPPDVPVRHDPITTPIPRLVR